jgi:hypothetical protein
MKRRKRMLEELDQGIRDHIARETHDDIDRGMPPEDAALRVTGWAMSSLSVELSDKSAAGGLGELERTKSYLRLAMHEREICLRDVARHDLPVFSFQEHFTGPRDKRAVRVAVS